jgi:hypothetical protein
MSVVQTPESEAQKLKRLKAEYQTVTSRLEEIRAEVKNTFANLSKLALPGVMEIANGRHGNRPSVEHPRPITDRISIAAGRAIVRAKRQGKSKEECKAAGIWALHKVAKKYGIEVTPSLLATVDKKIETRFS